MHLTKITLFFSLFLIIFSNTLSAANGDSSRLAKFITVADIHFNPFSGCTKTNNSCLLVDKLRRANFQEWEAVFEQYGNKEIAEINQDTNYPLLKTTLLGLQDVNHKENPQFVLILGDFLAHDFRQEYKTYSGDKTHQGYQAFVKKTLQFITYEFQKIFPKIDVYPVVGNNDSYGGDYQITPNGPFFQDTANTWVQLIKDKENRENFTREFPIAGYYHVNLNADNHNQIIILNSVLFSVHNDNPNVRKAAFVELAWLKKLLQENGKFVLLAYHIPDAIDVYATFQNKFSQIFEFWHPIYSKEFEKEVQRYSTNIKGMLSGHVHIDTYQAIALKRISHIPASITTSVSPIFGNDPGFKVFTFDTQTLQIKYIDSYFYPLNAVLPSWQKDFVFRSKLKKEFASRFRFSQMIDCCGTH